VHEPIAEQRAAAVAGLSVALAELTSDPDALDEQVVRRVGELVGDAAALWRKDGDGNLVLAAHHHPDPAVRAHMVELERDITHSWQQGVLPHAWNLTEPLVLGSEALAEWIPRMQPAYQAYIRAHGMVSLVLVPLRVRGATVALLGVSRDASPEHDAADVAFVTQMGAVVAVALDNRQLLHSLERQLAEQSRLHQAAHRASLHDPLTGLPNRRLLVDRMSELSPADGRAALLLVDLDGFKHVNDFYGHHVGDGVLVEVAARLSEVVAAQDRAGSSLVRLGGDEFAVLMAGPDEGPAAQELAERILTAVREPLHAVEARASLSASIGIACGANEKATELLHHADVAMYRAKRTGVGWAEYEPAVDDPARLRLRDVGQLQEALARGEIVPHFQPVVGRVDGGRQLQQLEVLARWQHPQRGLLRPHHFLPLAESTGLLPELTRQMVGQALDAVAGWRRDGLDVQVSVNMTAEGVTEAGLVQELRDMLDDRDLDASRLCVELTESELLVTSAVGSLHELRAAGIDVAIDDFGTGYSSLAYLADLPFDRLKLDQSFVRRLDDHPRIAQLVAGLVDCVHRLGHGVVAEGVELASQSAALDGLSVEWQQGFLFGRPAPREAATAWLLAG
jgi:diguanylate cyclase (GGDEF)-like protein